MLPSFAITVCGSDLGAYLFLQTTFDLVLHELQTPPCHMCNCPHLPTRDCPFCDWFRSHEDYIWRICSTVTLFDVNQLT